MGLSLEKDRMLFAVSGKLTEPPFRLSLKLYHTYSYFWSLTFLKPRGGNRDTLVFWPNGTPDNSTCTLLHLGKIRAYDKVELREGGSYDLCPGL